MTLIRAAAVVAMLSVTSAAVGQPSPTTPAPTAPQPAPTAPQPAPTAPQPAPTTAPSAPPAAGGPAPAAPTPPRAPPQSSDEASMTFTAQPTAPAPARGSSVEMEQFAQQTSEETKIGGAKARYSLNLFGDVGGGIVGGTHGYDTKPSFGINNFSLLFSGNLENAVKFIAEASVEPGEDNAIGIDLERLSIRWTAPNGIWIEAGRTHTALGYWNNAFHHGTWLQPTITRPRAVRFEDSGGILPIHWIGASLGWLMNLGGDTSLRSSVAVGNGRGYQEDDLQLKFDSNAPKQGYAQLELKGLGARDLRFGVSGVYGYISPDARRADPERLFEYIGGAHIAYPSAPLTLIAEGYAISHKGQARSWETYDGFILLGYTFAPLTPYLQFERVVMTHGVDPFYVVDPTQLRPPVLTNMTGLDVAEGIAGMRWDTSTWSAVKLEYRLARFLDQDLTTHMGYAAWQFGL